MTFVEIKQSLREIHRRLAELARPQFGTLDRQMLQAEAVALGQRIDALDAPLEVGDDRTHFICLCPDCVKPREAAVDYHLSRNNSVAVADDITYLPMETCPIGVKVLLLNRGGVAVLGVVRKGELDEWRGWFPLPKERKNER